jgi:hypothetical protein
VLAALRNIFVVVTITCLIWLFAESESLRTLQSPAEVVFIAETGSDRAVSVPDATEVAGGRVRAQIELEGSAAAIDRAERVLRRPLIFSPGMDGVPREPGDRLIRLVDAVRAHPELRSLGVTIRKIDPPDVRVIVDEMETRQLKVVPAVASEEIDGAIEVRPPVVSIRLPKSQAKLLTEASAVVATLDADVLRSLTRGRRQSIPGVSLSLPSELTSTSNASIEPRVADVSLTMRAQVRTITIASVPVHLRVAPAEFGKWEIEIPEQDRFLTDVSCTGSFEGIAAIENKSVAMVATLPLSFEELERGITSKEVVFLDLPQGVKAEASNRTVRLSIKRRVVDKKPGV